MPKLHFAGITIAPNVWEAVAIVAFIFAIILLLAYMSHNFLEWSLSGAGIGIIVGFILALILEGFLIVGGKTVITAALGWKNAPAPIQNILTTGHKQLLDALNVPASCSAVVK